MSNLSNIQKSNEEIPYYQFLKDFTYGTFLVGHEKPSKNEMIWTFNEILGCNKLKKVISS